MGTIKVKFKDGSMADVDEQVLPQAQKAGATIIESGSAPISGNVTVRFKDGSEAQINADVKDKALQAGAIIISEGGVKKKNLHYFLVVFQKLVLAHLRKIQTIFRRSR
jgi:hypothetical protein